MTESSTVFLWHSHQEPLYYRSDLIETPPTNWDELLATAKEVHSSNPDVYGFAIPTDITSGTDELLNFIYQNGGALVDDKGEITFDTEANVGTLEYLKQFNDEKLVPDVVSTARGDQATLFAMVILQCSYQVHGRRKHLIRPLIQHLTR